MPSSKKTWDKHPQFLNLTVVEGVANTFAQATYRTPVQNGFGVSGGHALVMEILKVFVNTAIPDIVNVTATSVNMQLTKTTQAALLALDDPDLIVAQTKTIMCDDTGATDATVAVEDPGEWQEFDLQSADGHGYLHPYQNLFIGVQGVGCTNVKSAAAKVLYRMVEVTASELVQLLGE